VGLLDCHSYSLKKREKVVLILALAF